MRRLKRWYFQFLRTAFYSSDSHHRVAMGAFWGFFWGLTPTVGIQITILSVQAALFYSLDKCARGKLRWLHFNLPLAIPCTMLSNPANMIPLYFAFYYVGAWLLPGYHPMGWTEFSEILKPLLTIDSLSAFKQGMANIGVHILYPMVMGSLFIAIPAAFLSYFGVRMLLARFNGKRKLAEAKRQKLRL